MNILGANINYDYREFTEGICYANDPALSIDVDTNFIPWEDLRWHRIGGYFYAEEGPVVHTIYKPDPSVSDDGFGGRVSKLTMVDGSQVVFAGGWHSNSGEMYKHGCPMVIECAVGTPQWHNTKMACWVKLEFANEALERYLPDWELYIAYRHGYCFPSVKRKGMNPKNPNKWVSPKPNAKRFDLGLSADQVGIINA